MDLLRSLAYDYYLGPFPLVVLVGFATYALLLGTALLVTLKRWIPSMRRVPVRVHRRLAIAVIAMATIHLLLGLSVYIQ